MASVAALKAPVAIKASVRAQRSSRRPLRVQAISDANLVVGGEFRIALVAARRGLLLARAVRAAFGVLSPIKTTCISSVGQSVASGLGEDRSLAAAALSTVDRPCFCCSCSYNIMRPPYLFSAACTVGALALGRFVFLPQHRAALKKAGVPTQNGKTHFEAGDRLAEEASFVLKT